MKNQNIEDGKTSAIISYLSWIGLLIAFIMNNSKKNSFASFHIRQMIGLLLLQLIVGAIGSMMGIPTIARFLHLGLFILWLIGFIGCIKGEEKKIPILGDIFQEWFKGI
ncbi:MAG: hypothetical protein COB81_03130 [Flavobacteriaceae bacterium]|nr:MAG: hypothetical protein COB81_03130 [Flavobacteriaceae bacterium]